jgi:hypothetical protein
MTWATDAKVSFAPACVFDQRHADAPSPGPDFERSRRNIAAVGRRSALIALVALAISGCGSVQNSGEQSTTTTSTAPSPQPSQQSSSGTIRRVSLLGHPTPRPPDVRQQFSYVGGAGPGACYFGSSSAPKISVLVEPFSAQPDRPGDTQLIQGRATYGQPTDVCFAGFGRGLVNVTVTGPNGFSLHGMLPTLPARDRSESGWESYDWVPGLDPSWPLGKYTVAAKSSVARATTVFTLIPPSEAGLRVLGPSTDPGHNEVPPDSFAMIYLIGFRGLSQVQLSVYELTGLAGRGRFLSSTTVPLPSSGNSILEIPTGHPSANTTFVVTTVVGQHTLYGAFNVTPPYHDPAMIVGSLPAH